MGARQIVGDERLSETAIRDTNTGMVVMVVTGGREVSGLCQGQNKLIRRCAIRVTPVEIDRATRAVGCML